MSRGLKQFIYGAGFLLFFSGIIFGVYALIFKAAPTCFDLKQNGNEIGIDCGGGCAPCAQKYAKDIEVGAIEKFPAGDAKTVIAAYLKNPNDDYGIRDVVYTIEVRGADGGVIQTMSDHLFMYDRKSKSGRYLIATIGVAKKDIADIAITFSDADTVTRDEFIEPAIAVKQSSTDITGLTSVTEPVYEFTKDIGMKTTGEDVVQLEIFLGKKKLFKKKPDGTFDLDTKLALTQYQKSKSITPANGIAEIKTRTAINREVERVTRVVVDPDGAVAVNGDVKNNGVVGASKTVITALIYDAMGVQLGASKTELDDIGAAEERIFKIVFPKTVPIQLIDTTRTQVFVDSIR